MSEMLNVNVLIVGGGPAGSSAGIHLIKKDIDCLIIDKSEFPRKKLCGGLITEKGINELEKINIDCSHEIFYRPTPIRFYNDNEKIFEYESDAKYAVVDRFRFDELLINKYTEMGGKGIYGEKIVNINIKDKEAVCSNGKIIKYQTLIGADGANSIVRKAINNKKYKLAFCTEVFFDKKVSVIALKHQGVEVLFNKIDQGYAWVFEGASNLSVGIGGFEKNNKEMVTKLKKLVNELGVTTTYKIQGAFIPCGKSVKNKCSHDIVLIGDAAGYVDPIFGEGISHAIEAGRLISEVVESKKLEIQYRRLFKHLIQLTKYGTVAQILFFWRPINRTAMKGFQRHQNLTERLCENIVIKGAVNYYDVRAILRLIFKR